MTKTKTADPKAEEPEVETEEPDARPEEPEASSDEVDEVEAAADEEAEADTPKAEQTAKKESEPEPSHRLRKDPLVRVALAVTVIAALICGWFGYSYRSASSDDSLAYAKERDTVLSAAGQAIVNLNTLDHRNVDAGLKVWQDSSTAQLYDEIVKGRSQLKSDIEKAKTTSTAKVLESALSELDTRAGKAAVIAAVSITITRAGGQQSTNMRRFAGQLTRTSSGWKLSALGQAPTGTS